MSKSIFLGKNDNNKKSVNLTSAQIITLHAKRKYNQFTATQENERIGHN